MNRKKKQDLVPIHKHRELDFTYFTSVTVGSVKFKSLKCYPIYK